MKTKRQWSSVNTVKEKTTWIFALTAASIFSRNVILINQSGMFWSALMRWSLMQVFSINLPPPLRGRRGNWQATSMLQSMGLQRVNLPVYPYSGIEFNRKKKKIESKIYVLWHGWTAKTLCSMKKKSQIQKTTCYVILFIWNIQKRQSSKNKK